MLRKVSWILIALILLCAKCTFAQTNSCNDPNRVVSIKIDINTNTTTRLIANPDSNTIPSQAIIVCNYEVVITGSATAQTIQFEYGTGNTCGTGTTTLTGAIPGTGTAATPLVISSPNFPFGKLNAGVHLCLITTQSVQVSGHLTYVIQN